MKNTSFSQRNKKVTFKKVLFHLLGSAYVFCSTASAAYEVDIPISSVNVSTSINKDWGKHNLIDGNVNTAWSSNYLKNTGGEAWVSVNFRSPSYIDYVKLYPRKDTYKDTYKKTDGNDESVQYSVSKASGFPLNFEIQYLSGNNWITSKKVLDFPNPAPSGYVHIPINRIHTSAIKIIAKKASIDSLGFEFFQLADVKLGYDTEFVDQAQRGISIYGDSTTWGFAWKPLNFNGQLYADRIDSPMANQLGAIDYSVPGIWAMHLVTPPSQPIKVQKIYDDELNGYYVNWSVKSFSELLAKDPSYTVILRLGLNDALNFQTRAQFKANMAKLVDIAVGYRKRVILTGLNRIFVVNGKISQKQVELRDDFDKVIREVATEKNVAFIDVGSVSFNGNVDIFDDAHATPEYNQRITDYIKERIYSLNIKN